MGPIGHTVISGAVGGGVWVATGSPAAAGVALGVGVFMDLDHLYDYYQRYIKGRQDKVYVLFHAWEYSLVGVAMLILAFYHPLLLGALLGHLAHVTTDHSMNQMSPFAYSISYRVIKRFDAAYISPRHSLTHSYRILPKLLPFGRRLEPWFRRRIEPWFLARINPAPQHEANTAESDD
jgi:hypothetical protein